LASKLSGIDSSHTTPVEAGRALQRVPDATAQAHSFAGSSGGDVHITDAAAQLATLEKTVSVLPSVDEARVGAIRSAIEEGRYAVSPERVADALMGLEHALAPLGDP
jgi:negative regulator of flagellin synthesis FlgM